MSRLAKYPLSVLVFMLRSNALRYRGGLQGGYYTGCYAAFARPHLNQDKLGSDSGLI